MFGSALVLHTVQSPVPGHSDSIRPGFPLEVHCGFHVKPNICLTSTSSALPLPQHFLKAGQIKN